MSRKRISPLAPFLVAFILMALSGIWYYVQFYRAYEKAIEASIEKSLVFSKLVDTVYPEQFKK